MAILWSPESSATIGRNDLERDIGGMIQEAINHVEHVLTPERAEATNFYFGRPFGNEEKGRSQVVDTTVRDTVQGMLPSLLRIFLGSERTVEFRPRSKEDELLARQKTDYVNYIIREDNDGFLQFNAAFLDALVRKIGVFKWWWEKRTREAGSVLEGVTEQDIFTLVTDPTVSDVEVVDEPYQLSPDGEVFYNVEIRRKYDESRARFEAVPPEEFLFTPTARSIDEATLVGHRRELRRSQLEAMGYKRKVLDEVGSYEQSISQNEESRARQQDESALLEGETDRFDPKYLYVEVFINNAGSWRKYCTLGSGYWIQNGGGKGELVEGHPFGVLPCIIEPHTIVGQSIADLTKDLQKLNSAVVRATVDSLGTSVMPRLAFDQYNVEPQDIVNTELGAPIRTKGPPGNALMEFRHSFVGGDTLPFLQWLNEVRENRTGQTKAAAGLDADALQSSTKAAVAATLTAAQQRIEMIARVFAETGIKALFKGLLKLVIEHQDRARVVRLRNEYIEVDPRSWDAPMDVTVHVGLGVGMPEDKFNVLTAITQKQEQIIAQLGPVNPLCTLAQYRNTLTRLVELAGFVNPDEFFLPVDPQQLQQMTQAAGQDQKPSPEEMLAQVQMEAIKADTQNKMQRLMLDSQKMAMDDDRERDKAAADFALRAAELEVKYSTTVDVAKIKADAQQARQSQMSGPHE